MKYLALFVLVFSCTAFAEIPGYEPRKVGKTFLVFVTYSEGVGKYDYWSIAVKSDVCGDLDVCVVMFWDDRRLMPTSLPMTDEQFEGMVARYNYNKHSGLERAAVCAIDGC